MSLPPQSPTELWPLPSCKPNTGTYIVEKLRHVLVGGIAFLTQLYPNLHFPSLLIPTSSESLSLDPQFGTGRLGFQDPGSPFHSFSQTLLSLPPDLLPCMWGPIPPPNLQITLSSWVHASPTTGETPRGLGQEFLNIPWRPEPRCCAEDND